MRRSGVIVVAATVLAGAAVSVIGVIVTRWWSMRHRSGDFGWYAYSPAQGSPRRYVDYLQSDPSVDWWALLLPAAIAGAVVALVLATAVWLTIRLRRVSTPDADASPS